MKPRPIRLTHFNAPAEFVVRPEGSVALRMDGQEIHPTDSVTLDGKTSVPATAAVAGMIEDVLTDRFPCESEDVKGQFLEQARAFCAQGKLPLN